MNRKVEKLIASDDPVMAYTARLFFENKDDPGLKARMLVDPRVAGLLTGLQTWPGPAIASHKSSQQFFHLLSFLSELGVSARDKPMTAVVKSCLATRDENGIPQNPVKIGAAYGGSGTEQVAWALCDAPTTLYALLKMGHEDKKTEQALTFLAGLVRENGWPCAVSSSLGNWRGPGKKSDPCPYATLIMLKLLLLKPEKFKQEIETGVSCLLSLWKNSRTDHPYIFYMGTDFRKLKMPLFWYDILHVADVLSRAPGIRRKTGFSEMLSVIDQKESTEGDFIPESVYLPWKNWDLGQKKKPSAFMLLAIERIRARIKSS